MIAEKLIPVTTMPKSTPAMDITTVERVTNTW